MNAKGMRLKARIKNLAKEKNMSAQIVLQNFMFERFLERLSKSSYKDSFILKGGILIASLVGIQNRATMDMDTTVKGYPLTEESLSRAVREICAMELGDEVSFALKGIGAIRPDDAYGGYRVSIIAQYEAIVTPLHIDMTAGDVITPKEMLYLFKMVFGEDTFPILAYNIETILAEKVETILQRGEFNTRPRDFYDVFILTSTYGINQMLFAEALRRTAAHRNSLHILSLPEQRLAEILKSGDLKIRWEKYRKDYAYASRIPWEEAVGAVYRLVKDSGISDSSVKGE